MDATPLEVSPKLPLPNCYWVLPGRLLAGEYPGGASTELTRERLQRLLEAGVECFFDLTRPGELAPYHPELPVSIDHVRKPIPDHSLPEKREHMAEILDRLGQALRTRRTVYLHCRAGIGRTGMVAGCLLVERGLAGDAALGELNRLWQQSERSRQWSAIPETAEQIEYVRGWTPRADAAAGEGREPDPLLDPETLSAARGLRARFLGALLGLAVGDAAAAATQYRRPGRFAPVGDLLGGGPFDLPRGAWSDDTAMALCLAESLLECNGFDARDQAARYHRWQQQGYLSATGQCLGITAATARALALAKWRRQAFSGSHDPQMQDPEPLSRVTPAVMYFFADAPTAVAQAAEAARTTCQAPAVLAACRSLARALHAALSGRSRERILEQGRTESTATTPAAPADPAGGTAPAALAAALDAFERTANFRDAVLAAANLGGHSDVVAGACGALAGAHYTADAIPALWRNSLMKQDLIEGYADRLLAHALLALGG
ncbi:MAG TPA: ADP-ribosylglycohydrolase family protein [Steroidobacteraceae bacterium]|nr:ADP-ribosylglycohydrolase family protein [Steroidobacteraceae bacterium]